MSSSKESFGSLLLHVVIPTILAIVTVGFSLLVDLNSTNESIWFQRSGAIVAAAGIYIAFHENGKRYESSGSTLNINTKIWYQWLALCLGIVGTLIWAYGDLVISEYV